MEAGYGDEDNGILGRGKEEGIGYIQMSVERSSHNGLDFQFNGKKKLDNQYETVDNVHYELFAKKKINEKLPPTMDSFGQHLKRANLQSDMWKHATIQHLQVSLVNNCWLRIAWDNLGLT
ncbi:hypothetical protein KIL84_016026 [Mauremys mutica]|uniref:Uncharacterized protein n=1 Tax=Mauremys mutica TaxID=74926 RepID=A0A9D3WMZ2_9SAUR|nr:hypothetical protein KIL84_016026 [Mauremys mutica]